MTTKDELRATMRARLKALPPAEVRSASATIWEKLAVLPAFADAQPLLVYVSHGTEIETHGLIQQLLALGRRVCVPAFDETLQRYIASEISEFPGDVQPGKFGILEPPPAMRRRVHVEQLAVSVVPGLAFARDGHRLGRGMGYFDRILTGTGGAKIGLAFAFQVVAAVPTQAHDVQMDYIVTETETIDCGKGQS